MRPKMERQKDPTRARNSERSGMAMAQQTETEKKLKKKKT